MSNPRPPFRLGDWTVIPELHRIEGEGGVTRVEPRVMETLLYLTERPGRAVSREEILAEVWAGTVVTEEALTRVISVLRNALGDEARRPRYIETIYKGGYRLIEEPGPVDASGEEGGEGATAPKAGPGRRFAIAVVAGSAAMIVLVATLLRLTAPAPPSAPVQLPLTAEAGSEQYPALSPDGSRVAFAWAREDEAHVQLWIAATASPSPRPLTDAPGRAHASVFSPSGNEIAFLHEHDGVHSVRRTRVLDEAIDRAEILFESPARLGGIDWSPDGNRLALVIQEGRRRRIAVLDANTGAELPVPGTGPLVGNSPRFSPDGRWLALFAPGPMGVPVLQVIERASGRKRTVAGPWPTVRGLDWTADGSALVASVVEVEDFVLRLIDAGDGTATTIPVRSRDALRPAIAGSRLVYEEVHWEMNIWSLDLDEPAAEPRLLMDSTRLDYGARFAPERAAFAFYSSRSGFQEIWIQEDGADRPRQVSDFRGAALGRMRWSPTGEMLAVHALRSGRQQVVLVDPWSAAPTTGTCTVLDAEPRFWSADGIWIYVLGHEPGRVELRKVRSDGTGSTEVLGPGRRAWAEWNDGLLVQGEADQSIRWLDPVTGEEEVIVDAEVVAGWRVHGFDAGRFVLSARAGTELNVATIDPAERRLRVRATIPFTSVTGVALSPDARTVAFDVSDVSRTDLILVEDFE